MGGRRFIRRRAAPSTRPSWTSTRPTTSEALHAETTRRLVSNTTAVGTDVEELADHMKATAHRPTASVAILDHDQGNEQQHEDQPQAWLDEHPPAGIAGWQTHKRTSPAKTATDRSRDSAKTSNEGHHGGTGTPTCSDRPGQNPCSNGRPLRCREGPAPPLGGSGRARPECDWKAARPEIEATLASVGGLGREFSVFGCAFGVMGLKGTIVLSRRWGPFWLSSQP